jgi:hypothetical protein
MNSIMTTIESIARLPKGGLAIALCLAAGIAKIRDLAGA